MYVRTDALAGVALQSILHGVEVEVWIQSRDVDAEGELRQVFSRSMIPSPREK